MVTCPCCVVYGPSPWTGIDKELNEVSRAVTEFIREIREQEYDTVPELPQPFLPAFCEEEGA